MCPLSTNVHLRNRRVGLVVGLFGFMVVGLCVGLHVCKHRRMYVCVNPCMYVCVGIHVFFIVLSYPDVAWRSL